MLLRTIVLYGGFVVVPLPRALQRSNVSSSPLSTSSYACSSVLHFVFAFTQDSHCHSSSPRIAFHRARSAAASASRYQRCLHPSHHHHTLLLKARGTFESQTLLRSPKEHRKPVCTFSLSSYPPSIFIRPPAQHRSLQ